MITSPTSVPTTVEEAASPEAALALAEVEISESDVPTVEAPPTPEAPVAEVASDLTAAMPVEASPTAEEPAIDQDELVVELRAQLSDRSGRRNSELVAPTETAVPTNTAVPTSTPTARPKVATKTPTPRPTVRVATKTPTPKPAPTKVPTPRPTIAPSSSTFGQKVASIALRYVGYRYTYGGISPSTGFDCSGFAYYVYKTAGRPISRSLGVQYSTGIAVSRSSLQAGDLVFFKNTYKYGLSHVGIYVGGGRFVHAQSETTGVRVSTFDSYWGSHYLGARRP